MIRKETTAAGKPQIPPPFVGPVNHTVPIQVDITQFTAKEIDDNGYLKPGVPLTKAGAMLVATNFVFGVTVDYKKVAPSNSATDIAAAGNQDVPVVTICQVNQDVAEDILERAYTAAEIAGFDLAGSKCVLL